MIDLPRTYTRLLSTLVPGLLIVAVSVYALAFKPQEAEPLKVLPGKPLAAYDELYPIRADSSGQLYLDKDRFVEAIHYFAQYPSPKAISDLIYLGNSNSVSLLLSDSERHVYQKLTALPNPAVMGEAHEQTDRIFQVYKDIVNGIGQTFADTPIEIVLHDTRNPLKSIVAIQNPISGRRLGDTNTNFGLQLIKNYSQLSGQGTSFVSYGLTLKDGRQIKSTTIPLFHETYGLVGFICMNIDVSKLDGKDTKALEHFLENFKAINPNAPISELIQNSKRKG